MNFNHKKAAPRNKFVRVCKINDSPKSSVERWVDSGIFELLVLGVVCSLAALDEGNLTQESRAEQRLEAGRYKSCIYAHADSRLDIGLGVDVHGIRIINLAAQFRVATLSSTLADGLAQNSGSAQ